MGTSAGNLMLVHHHPGRLRLRGAALRADVPLLSKLQQTLAALNGVRSASASERTGSLLVHYDPERVDAETLLGVVGRMSGLPIETREEHAQKVRGRVPLAIADSARNANDAIFAWTGYRLEPRALVPIGLLGFATYSFVANERTRLPRWDNLVYWSYALFHDLYGAQLRPLGYGRGPELERAP